MPRSHPLPQVVTTKNASRHREIFYQETELPWLRITALDPRLPLISFQNRVKASHTPCTSNRALAPEVQTPSCDSVTSASFASKDCGFHLLWGWSYRQEIRSCYKMLFTWEVAVRIIVRERTLGRGWSGDFSPRKDCSKRRGLLASVM